MAQARGYKENLCLGFESTFGTAPASMVKLPFNSAGLRASQSLSDPGTITGSRNPVKPIAGNIDVAGDVTAPLDTRAIGYWLKLLLGAPSTSGSGTYTHTFTPADVLPSAAVDLGFVDNPISFDHFSLFTGLKAGSMSFSFGGDGEMTTSISLTGRDESVGTSPQDADPTTLTFTRFEQFDATIQEGATLATLGNATEISLSIENNLDSSVYCIGDEGKRTEIPEGMIKVSGTMKCLFENQTLFNKAVNGTESGLQIGLSHDSGAATLTFLMQELIYERATIERNGAAGMYVSLPFTAFYSAGSVGAALRVILANNVSSY